MDAATELAELSDRIHALKLDLIRVRSRICIDHRDSAVVITQSHAALVLADAQLKQARELLEQHSRQRRIPQRGA